MPLERLFKKTDAAKVKEPKNRIKSISIPGAGLDILPAPVRRDYETALRDLAAGSVFQPVKDRRGPYTVELSIEENRLVFHITNARGRDIPYLVLSLKPYSRIIKDYFMIVQSYNEALADGKPSRIEAIDMGRRGLHNEGAELLLSRLSDKIMLDHDTARRLFTLICVLHSGKTHILR